MSTALFKFLGKLLPSLKRSSVLEDIKVTTDELKDTVIPCYSDLASHFQLVKLKSPEMLKLDKIFYQEFKYKGSKQASIFGDINIRTSNILANLGYVEDNIEKLFETDVVREGLSAKKTVLLRLAESFAFITRFAMDLADYAFWYEAKAYDGDIAKKYDMTPNKIKRIENGIRAFARCMTDLSDSPDAFRKQITEVPEVHLSQKDYDTINSLYSPTKLSPFESSIGLSGFTYSPVYHVRLLYAEWQTARYHSMKDKKRALSVKLLYLKELKEGSDNKNPQLDTEIEYLQKRIDGYDRDIHDMERDANLDA